MAPSHAGSVALGTSVDHLYRRQSVYWWQRRIPPSLGIQGPCRIARYLRTANPNVARRRARACSAAFDHVIMRFMTESAPARVDLVRVLDTQHRRQWHISAALAPCAHTRALAAGSCRPASHCNAYQ